MILATICTGGYDWTVVAEDHQDADEALLEAYAKHTEQTPLADPALMAQAIEDGDVNYAACFFGEALRDGEAVR
jgi:hypothetical protein